MKARSTPYFGEGLGATFPKVRSIVDQWFCKLLELYGGDEGDEFMVISVWETLH